MRTRVLLVTQNIAQVVSTPRWFEFWASGSERQAVFHPGDGWFYDYGGQRVKPRIATMLEQEQRRARPVSVPTDDSIDLARRLTKLGPDVRACYEELVTKAEGGHEKYGELRILSDARDFEAEARMELLDCVHYLGYRLVELKSELARVKARLEVAERASR